MKKIININLSGRVIPIEDSAYEKLQAYIESLRRYFSKEEGKDEIINDIESRIAELMNEKIRKGANAITDADIDEIAASMGRPEDFDADLDEDEKQRNAGKEQASTASVFDRIHAKRRLYRNTNDRVIGGVCSGIANYLDVDPSIVRLLFAIVTFGGFGFGILAYIILWIVLPEANTEYQKMEMRGERIDVNRIKQNVQDKAREFGEELKTAANEFSSKVGGYSKERSRQFAREFGQAAGNAGIGLGHVIGVIFKAFFFFIAGSIAFGLFVALLALLFSGVAWWPFNNFLFTSDWQKMLAWGTVIFFLIVPLVGFITWLVRRIMKIRSGSGYMGWTFGALWTLGWVCVIWLAASVTRDFRYFEEGSKDMAIAQPTTGKLTVGVTAPELNFQGGYGWMNDDRSGWDISEDSLTLSWVNIEVSRSKDSAYHVILWKNAFGRDNQDARSRASRIGYEMTYTDNSIRSASGRGPDLSSPETAKRSLMAGS
ncbi:MAG: hypothetical protein B7Z54_03385, partial [Sphingobacteriales bacterium 12-47-4]